MKSFIKTLEEENLSDCYYLEKGDVCFYFGDYTPRGGYDCSDVNRLIANLKKGIDRKDRGDYKYKDLAIEQCVSMVKSVLNDVLEQTKDPIVIIPIPPSKSKEHQLYDDRMLRIATQASLNEERINVIEFVEQIHSTDAFHLSESSRPTPNQLQNNYRILKQIPQNSEVVLIFDDVLTTGSHFKAIKNLLLEQYPYLEGKIYGLFIAKVVRT